MIHPLSDYLYIRLVPMPDRTEGGVFLPNTGHYDRIAWDGVVESIGPGVMDRQGRFGSFQATYGDRVVCQQAHYMALDGESGVVRDRHLVARIPGPDYETLLPCGAYVALAPDPIQRVRESEGGVLVAAQSFRGAQFRFRRRGEELYREFHEAGRRYLAQGHERWELREWFRREIAALGKDDQEALVFAFHKRGETEFAHYVVPSSVKHPGSGRILGFGGLVPDTVRALGTGARVWWDKDAQLIDSWDGFRSIVMVRWDELAAMEEA